MAPRVQSDSILSILTLANYSEWYVCIIKQCNASLVFAVSALLR